MTKLKITEAMREAARRLLQTRGSKISGADRALLAAISEGKRKLIDAPWWKKVHSVVDQVKLGKLQRLADPARNPNEHERALAARKLGEFKARRPPGLLPEAPPLPPTIEEWTRKPSKRRPAPPPRRGLPTPVGGVNKKVATGRGAGGGGGGGGGVNKKPKRTGDRHLDKSDRHAPGYMRDYMRRRRAKLRQSADPRR